MKQLTIYISILILTLLSSTSFGQSPITKLQFHVAMNGESLVVKEEMKTGLVSVSKFRFYLSNLEFYQSENLIYKEPNSYHLLDASSSTLMQIKLDTVIEGGFDQLTFDIGIDSLTNDQGAQSGDLDPSEGMYWAWQSGYINFKLEGYHPNCTSPNQDFQYHIGGFLKYNPIQHCTLSISDHKHIDIEINLDPIMDRLDFDAENHIMRPCQEALNFSKLFPQMFSLRN